MRPGIDGRVSLRSETRRWRALAGLLLVNLAALLLGSLPSPAISPRAALWFASLYKPAWTPPDALLTVLWLAVYVISAVAAWRIWHRRHSHRAEVALGLYFVQLGLAAAWPPVFFGLRSPGAGLLLLLLLLTTLGFTIGRRRASRTRGRRTARRAWTIREKGTTPWWRSSPCAAQRRAWVLARCAASNQVHDREQDDRAEQRHYEAAEGEVALIDRARSE